MDVELLRLGYAYDLLNVATTHAEIGPHLCWSDDLKTPPEGIPGGWIVGQLRE